MLRPLLVLAGLLWWAPARAAPCAPFPAAPLPAVATKARDATSIASSRKWAKAIAKEAAARTGSFADAKVCTLGPGEDGGWLQQVTMMDDLVRHEPADFETRAELLALMTAAVERAQDTNCQVQGNATDPDCCIDKSCRAMRATVLADEEALRDQAYAGCKACTRWLAEFRTHNLDGSLGKSPEVTRFVDSLAAGPPGPLSTATLSAIGALALLANAPDDDARDRAIEKLEPFLGARTPPLFHGGGLMARKDPVPFTPPKSLSALQRAGLHAIDEWTGAFMVGFPDTGSVMTCTASCCSWRFEDAHPHAFQITQVCFDAKLHLTSISTALGGP